ncbi:hypothetical protein PF011_g19294 [Phytophthora fragariae]|uniref:Uncharacterized protein n=1 Tax=Phytophthora fragariae TaxID=53985 RepID=A0A6A3J1C9_9STRA|nr:hypothetical protein PF011_g19294 [Phytophthora fragariae]
MNLLLPLVYIQEIDFLLYLYKKYYAQIHVEAYVQNRFSRIL